MAEHSEDYQGAGCLVVMATLAGALAGTQLVAAHPIGLGIAIGVAYIIAAGMSVTVSQALWLWSRGPDKTHHWTLDEKAWIGAFWPVTLPFYLLASLFFAIVSRI